MAKPGLRTRFCCCCVKWWRHEWEMSAYSPTDLIGIPPEHAIIQEKGCKISRISAKSDPFQAVFWKNYIPFYVSLAKEVESMQLATLMCHGAATNQHKALLRRCFLRF